MATTLDPQPLTAPPRQRTKPTARRSSSGRWVLMALLLGFAALAYFVGVPMIQSYWRPTDALQVVTDKAERGELIVTVKEDGNVESAANIDVKCHVAGGTTILWIVADGTEAKKGDRLVKLDDANIQEQINSQTIIYERAVATRIQAEKEFEAAKIGVQEYLEGTFPKDLQLVEAQISVALENLRSAENTLQHTTRLARKGYVTPLQLDAQKFAVEKAKLDLRTAELAKSSLEKFTKIKMLGDLETKRDTAEAKMRSEQAACKHEGDRLKRLQAQLENCEIFAPQDGMVVYANESSSRYSSGSGVKVEEGASVRDQQTIVRVPDLSQMQCRVLVHESKIDQLSPGMRAQLRIQDKVFQGEVMSIANQPEPGGWSSSHIKEYAAVVRIDGDADNKLRPGMTAECEILVADIKDATLVPVQAVVEMGNKFYIWVKGANGKLERRPVLVGITNTKVIEIKDGVAPGEDVVLNPRTVIAEARSEVIRELPVDVKGKFGQSQSSKSAGTPKLASGGPAAGGSAAGGTANKSRPNIMNYDANGDGKVSLEEMPEQARPFFSKIDTNGDGFVDAAELAASAKHRAEQGGGGGPRAAAAPAGGIGAGGGGGPRGGGAPAVDGGR